MPDLRALSFLLVTVCGGCTASALEAPKWPLRVLNSELPSAPSPEPEGSAQTREAAPVPRIGAPGGSGAGSRRVSPAQSGKETVGGLPAGIGASAGPAGRG